jgi:hypothetical protein
MNAGESVLVTIRGTFSVLWTVTGSGTCRSCQAPVLWCRTTSGNLSPVDVPRRAGIETVSHFSTCPNAKQWRRR